MQIDVDGLNNEVRTDLRSAMRYLEFSKNSINSINIPRDFKYYSKLKNIPQDITNIYSKIDSIDKWIDWAISNFKGAELNNNILIANLVGSIPTMQVTKSNNQTAKETVSEKSSKAESKEEKKSKKSKKKSLKDYVLSGEMFEDAANSIVNTASDIGDSWSVGMDYITSGYFVDDVTNAAKDVWDNGSEYVLSGKMAKDAGEVAKKTASVVGEKIVVPWYKVNSAIVSSNINTIIGTVKGAGQLLESITDGVTMAATGAGSVFTGVFDVVTYAGSLITDNNENWNSVTGSMWKKVMGFVSEEHVDNVFKSFYSKNIVGKWLDENALGIFKSNGAVTNVSSGIGYVGGIVLLTLATARHRNSGDGECFNIYSNSFIYYSNCCWSR